MNEADLIRPDVRQVEEEVRQKVLEALLAAPLHLEDADPFNYRVLRTLHALASFLVLSDQALSQVLAPEVVPVLRSEITSIFLGFYGVAKSRGMF